MSKRTGERNPIHRDLRDPKYRKRIERKRKGKGSYTRKGRFPAPLDVVGI